MPRHISDPHLGHRRVDTQLEPREELLLQARWVTEGGRQTNTGKAQG